MRMLNECKGWLLSSGRCIREIMMWLAVTLMIKNICNANLRLGGGNVKLYKMIISNLHD